MRLLSALLLVCLLFLFFFAGTAKPVSAAKDNCHPKTEKKSACHKKKKTDDGCTGAGCAMTFLCPLCGFEITEALRIQTPAPAYLQKPVSHHKIGQLSAYHQANWKPPKI